MTQTKEEPVIRIKRILDERDIAKNWIGVLILGILSLLAGAAAIVLPRVATFVVEIVIGWLLVIEGIIAGFYAFQMRGHNGFWWKLLGGILAIGAGILLLMYPTPGIITLSILLGVFFITSGFIKCVLASNIRPTRSWGGLLVSGGIDILLGLSIVIFLPEAAAWVIGLLFGISLLVHSVWLISLSLSARKMGSKLETA